MEFGFGLLLKTIIGWCLLTRITHTSTETNVIVGVLIVTST